VRIFGLSLALLLFVAGVAPADPSTEARFESDIDLAPPAGDLPGGEGARTASPRKAFLLSLVVPGLGQMYGSGWNLRSWHFYRGLGYGAFEAVAWVEEQQNLGAGLDKQTEYRAYAAANWQWKEICADWNGGDGAVDDDPFVYDPDDANDFYIDTAAESLEFYEDIHKLQKWICGWNDYETDGYLVDEANDLWETPMQLTYRSMRQEQNRLMSRADHWLYAILFNHLASAFDAYFTARAASGGPGNTASFVPLIRVRPEEGRGAAVALAWRF